MRKTKAIAITIAAMLCSCTNAPDTRRTLEDAGYEDVKIGGYAPFACGKGDTSQTSFTAKNIRGKVVSGVVCCGLFMKGCTIRH